MEAVNRLYLKGTLEGHDGWVTSIATPLDPKADFIVSSGRDKSVLVWTITRDEGDAFGVTRRMLTGHGHFVSDVVLSADGQFALSASWDGTLRLWELKNGKCSRLFAGHTKDVLSVAFSADNRQIVSGGRDRSVRLWNTLGECKFVMIEDGHTEWVSCVRFSPSLENPVVVSAGWDKLVKVWSLSTYKLVNNLVGHAGYINSVTVAPDGSLCASGGKDGTAMLWDLNKGEHLYSLDANDVINALCFSPNRYWLCAATQQAIKIWDLESKGEVASLTPDFGTLSRKALKPACTCLAWSVDGTTLYAGYTDGKIRAFVVV